MLVVLVGCGASGTGQAGTPLSDLATSTTTATTTSTTTTEPATTTTTEIDSVVTRIAPEVVASLIDIESDAATVRDACSTDPAGSTCNFGLTFGLLRTAADAERLGGLLTQANPDPSYSTSSPFLLTQAAITGVVRVRDAQLACDPPPDTTCVVEELAVLAELEYLGSMVEDWEPYL